PHEPSHPTPFRTAHGDDAAPARGPRCPRARSLAQSLEYAHTVRDVSIAAGGTDRTLWTVANWLRWLLWRRRRLQVRGGVVIPLAIPPGTTPHNRAASDRRPT